MTIEPNGTDGQRHSIEMADALEEARERLKDCYLLTVPQREYCGDALGKILAMLRTPR